MKKGLLFIALIGMSFGIKAQEKIQTEIGLKADFIYKNGNVGIGTTNPFSGTANQGLHINKGIHSSILFNNPTSGSGGIVQTSDGKQRIFIGANLYDDQNGSWSSFQTGKGSAGISIIADEGGWGTSIDFITSQLDEHYNSRIRILGNGNVGIGTTTPTEKLQIENGIVKIRSNNNTDRLIWSRTDNTMKAGLAGDGARKMFFLADNLTRMTIDGLNGNVGIGTTTPDMKLTVKGNIHAEEVKIDLNVPAPDYVFKEEYNLRSIEEVEDFINKNNHLPEIPSAKEFKKNGVMQAEMDMNLLKKIEELTLYTIQQEKKIKDLESLNKKLLDLQKRLEKLERK